MAKSRSKAIGELPNLTASGEAVSGVCRVCGCTKYGPCDDPESGDACGWRDDTKTLCTVCYDNGGSPYEFPDSKVGWQGYVDRAAAMLLFGSMRDLGIAVGSLVVDEDSCRQAIRRGEALGYAPTKDAAKCLAERRYMIALTAVGLQVFRLRH